MTAAPAAAGQPGRDDLTSRIFRALYQDFSLRTINGIYVVVPKGIPCFASSSLGPGHPRAPLGTGRPVGLGGRDPPLAWAGDLGAAVLIGALAGLPSALRAASLSPAKALWIL